MATVQQLLFESYVLINILIAVPQTHSGIFDIETKGSQCNLGYEHKYKPEVQKPLDPS